MKKRIMKRAIALIMAMILVCNTNVAGIFANGTKGSDLLSLGYSELKDVAAETIRDSAALEHAQVTYAETDVVRVMIVLEDDPALTLSDENFTMTSEIIAYRQELQTAQKNLAEDITEDVLSGEELDVVWNLTLAANAISANVEYGFIEEIQAMEGVAQVIIETVYMPMKAETSNVISQEMTGALGLKNESGYTGAGRKVAVIDTGTDTNHQSFDALSYEYALSCIAAEKGMSLTEYMESLDLLTVDKIDEVLTQLNCYDKMEGNITAEDLYISSKLPFNFNYVDVNFDVTHDNDGQGEHGSHVAGISVANRYISVDDIYDFNRDGVCDLDDAQAIMDYIISDEAIQNFQFTDLNEDGKLTAYDVFEVLNYMIKDEAYVEAADTVAVTGVASEAQLVTMKVFGAAGGAYSSDYIAATEDAIILGCDVANLSLGTAFAGFSGPTESTAEGNAYINYVMDLVAESDMVMAVAAGNQGHWADYDNAYGYMYADEAGTSTVGAPATYADSFAVASVDNIHMITTLTTKVIGADGESYVLNPPEAGGTTRANWSSLDKIGKGTTYDLVFVGDPTNLFAGQEQTDLNIYGGSEEAFDGDYAGKIVLIARGNDVLFTDKHSYAGLAEAAAVIIYNNAPGDFYFTVDGSTSDIPCAYLSFAEAKSLFDLFALEDGMYTAEMMIREEIAISSGANQQVTMSDFSSWGATGKLEIKPEIAAPGGGIYSVNGILEDTNGYEIMSGTSMATPHISGLVALANQYFAEEDILSIAREVSGNDELTLRELAQSLIMSTAVPVLGANELEASIRQQGAGLAQIQNVVDAESFILVNGQEGGKVKAELGDGTDAWTFTFTVNNLTNKAITYTLDANILTLQPAFAGEEVVSLHTMMGLEAEVTFVGEGVEEDVLTLGANASTSVTVTVDVNEEFAAELAQIGYTNGFYVEGFVYVTPEDGVEHSIPLLGWYGNWTDPSMYDTSDIFDYIYGTLERPGHFPAIEKNMLTWMPNGATSEYHYTGNIYGGLSSTENGIMVIGDSRYLEERNAINTSSDAIWGIGGIYPTLIRNAGACKVVVTDSNSGEIYFEEDFEEFDTRLMGSFFHYAYGQWYDTTIDNAIPFEWDYTDANGELLQAGTNVTISLICVPEYYVDEDGTVDWESAGHGTDLSFKFTVDNEKPQLAENVDNPFTLVVDGETETLKIKVQDDNYIAAVILLNGSADSALMYEYPDMDVDQKGEAIEVDFDITGYRDIFGDKAAIVVCDYAGNETYYAINLNGEGEPYGEFFGFQYDYEGYANTWVSFENNVNYNETCVFGTFEKVVAAEYVNGYIFAQNDKGELYAISMEDMLANTVDLNQSYVATLEHVYQDFAYNYATGKLYGLLSYEDQWGLITEVYGIDLSDGCIEDMYPAASQESIEGYALACAPDGTFYVMATNGQDDIAKLYSGKYAFSLVGTTEMGIDYLQAMTWNHNDGNLYWSRFYDESLSNLVSQLVKVNPETGACEVLGNLSSETAGLVVPLSDATAALDAYQNVPEFDSDIIGTPVLNLSNLNLSLRASEQLKVGFEPWYTSHKEVTWSTSDETVATVNDGLVVGVGEGTAVIRVTSVANPEIYAECTVVVSALTLEIEGLISYSPGGLNYVSDAMMYQYSMVEGAATMTPGNTITAEGDYANFGLKIGASTIGRNGNIWACEWNNVGMIYEIDSETGAVVNMLEPINGDVLYGISYSQKTDMFAGIMNFYLYVDQPFTTDIYDEMADSYDEEANEFMWHKFDMSSYLNASQGNLVTNEEGTTDIVFTGITSIDNAGEQYLMTDFTGEPLGEAWYTPDTTLVLLDNVGRLWYIDEVCGLVEAGGAYGRYDGSAMIPAVNGVMAVEYENEADDSTSYNVFVIREIVETPLYHQFLNGELGITYHFSSIHYAGEYAYEGGEGATSPMFVFSLYNYWFEAASNQLYLYIPGHETDEWNNETYEYIRTPDTLYNLGTTGHGYLIATINSARVTGGLPGLDD